MFRNVAFLQRETFFRQIVKFINKNQPRAAIDGGCFHHTACRLHRATERAVARGFSMKPWPELDPNLS
jgi:hypothetical protein